MSFIHLSEHRHEILSEVDPEDVVLLPGDQTLVQRVCHLLGDGQIPQLEDLVLVRVQQAHHLLVFPGKILVLSFQK